MRKHQRYTARAVVLGAFIASTVDEDHTTHVDAEIGMRRRTSSRVSAYLDAESAVPCDAGEGIDCLHGSVTVETSRRRALI